MYRDINNNIKSFKNQKSFLTLTDTEDMNSVVE